MRAMADNERSCVLWQTNDRPRVMHQTNERRPMLHQTNERPRVLQQANIVSIPMAVAKPINVMSEVKELCDWPCH